MANIKLKNVSKSFKNDIALNDVNLEIENNEFFVLFGPAGAGKTTMLKVIAGIELPEKGFIEFDDKIMNLVEPMDRNVSMVFENYALYPHMNAYDNMASPLRSPKHKTDEEIIKRKVMDIAFTMGIDQLTDRLPKQLSNGQRQRVALGRALVRDPNVFLMDEPLAHLDAKLKNLMRTELKSLQEKIDATTIYVTHDYLEALSLGDRIAIINNGKIVQIGNGDEIYYTPNNEFVAKLVGEPEINIFDGKINYGETPTIEVLNTEYILHDNVLKKFKNNKYDKVHVGLRGNNIKYHLPKETELKDDYIKGNVYNFEPIGNKSILMVEAGEEIIRTIVPNNLDIDLDEEIYLELDIESAMFFDADTSDFITRYKGITKKVND